MVLGSVLEPAWIHSQAVQVCHKYRQVVMCFADVSTIKDSYLGETVSVWKEGGVRPIPVLKTKPCLSVRQ